jgi:7-cyano-7-deazaguanine synthase
MNQTQRAVVILSGGLDSTTCLALARSEGLQTFALTFDYGQRHRRELDAARLVAKRLGAARHVITELPLFRTIGGSALTDDTMEVRTDGVIDDDIPTTYVPARNLVFLSLAAAYAETVGATSLWIGVNELDYSGYPDCRPEFIDAFANTLALATRAGVQGQKVVVRTPLLHLSKSDIVKLGAQVDAPFELTVSCYAGTEEACGVCDSCRLRLRGFAEAGVIDPIAYKRH